MKKTIGAIVFTVVSFAAAGGVWYMVIGAPSEAVANADATVEGTVVTTEITVSQAGGDAQRETVYSPTVTYRYTYGGETYTSTNLWAGPGEGYSYGDRSEAEAIVEEFPEGATITVHLDSENPSQSYLETEPTELNDYFPVVIPAAFGVMGLLGLGKQVLDLGA